MSMSRHVEELLEEFVETLQIPSSRYESAERSYKSVGDWLHRDASTLRDADPQVYVQGSFRLGTAIRPISDNEDYDIDLVCELKLSKNHFSQADLKAALRRELVAYAEAHRLAPPEEGRRCWTLNYAEGAQFHLDTLPAIPDGDRQRALLEQYGLSTQWANTAIAITDREDPSYRDITEHWPRSNPKGFANWFHLRMAAVFEARRRALALEAHAAVEDIPEYRVRTPLQNAIQILKCHRDNMFVDRSEDKPISIIITTLAAHAYQQEGSTASALFNILQRMDAYIENRKGIAWVPNPADPLENFADRWLKYPERRVAFYEWLDVARKDFGAVAVSSNRQSAVDLLEQKVGRRLSALKSRSGGSSLGITRSRLLNPPHRQAPPWSLAKSGNVRIERGVVLRNGFRPVDIINNGKSVPKGCEIRFEAVTDVPEPYQVYWQVVNTGAEAEQAHDLRGNFSEGVVSRGTLTQREGTRYAGTHSIECFIVKRGYLVAQSGQFLVNIQ